MKKNNQKCKNLPYVSLDVRYAVNCVYGFVLCKMNKNRDKAAYLIPYSPQIASGANCLWLR